MIRTLGHGNTWLRWLTAGVMIAGLLSMGQGCPPPVDDDTNGDQNPPDNEPPDDNPPDDEPPVDEPPDNEPPDNEPPDNEPPDEDPVIAGVDPQDPRSAFASQCALNVITCTTSWPTAVLEVQALAGQSVTSTAEGYLVLDSDGSGNEEIQFIGASSTAGDGATTIEYEWSYGATDDDPRTLAAGTIFSYEANPRVVLKTGFHYIRLTVRNDIIRDFVFSNDFGVLFENIQSFDFEEVEIEVR
jgi:hypothetical protein